MRVGTRGMGGGGGLPYHYYTLVIRYVDNSQLDL